MIKQVVARDGAGLVKDIENFEKEQSSQVGSNPGCHCKDVYVVFE